MIRGLLFLSAILALLVAGPGWTQTWAPAGGRIEAGVLYTIQFTDTDTADNDFLPSMSLSSVGGVIFSLDQDIAGGGDTDTVIAAYRCPAPDSPVLDCGTALTADATNLVAGGWLRIQVTTNPGASTTARVNVVGQAATAGAAGAGGSMTAAEIATACNASPHDALYADPSGNCDGDADFTFTRGTSEVRAGRITNGRSVAIGGDPTTGGHLELQEPGASGNVGKLTFPTGSADRDWTMPDDDGEVLLDGTAGDVTQLFIRDEGTSLPWPTDGTVACASAADSPEREVYTMRDLGDVVCDDTTGDDKWRPKGYPALAQFVNDEAWTAIAAGHCLDRFGGNSASCTGSVQGEAKGVWVPGKVVGIGQPTCGVFASNTEAGDSMTFKVWAAADSLDATAGTALVTDSVAGTEMADGVYSSFPLDLPAGEQGVRIAGATNGVTLMIEVDAHTDSTGANNVFDALVCTIPVYFDGTSTI